MLWRLALVATAALAFTAEAADFFLNAGGPSVSGFRCDTGKFSNNANKYTGREKSLAVGGWKDVYQSHAYPSSPTGDLEYKIPVEDGSYTVFLMFGETTMTAPDKRLFTVKINGQLLNGGGFNAGGVLDVFTAGGGKKNAPFFFNAGLKASAGGFMTITLGRIPGKDNPMISGIVLKGANADAKVGSEGVDSCGSNGVVDPEKPKPGTCTPVVTGREANMFTMNVGAGSVKRINFGGDNVNYIVEDNIGVIAKAETEVIDNGQWPEPQQNYRYTRAPTITYKIPVEPGTYNVGLLFTESYFKEAGKRKFDIIINGMVKAPAFDVFAAQGGYNKPGYKGFGGIAPVGGFLTIQLKKVVENPFLNGIVIRGTGAGSKAIGGPDVGPATAKGKCEGGGGGGHGGNCDTVPAPAVSGQAPNKNYFRVNIGAGSVARVNFGGDNINYIVEDNIGLVAKPDTPVIDNGQWPEPQQSYRYTQEPTLTYKIPVGAGTYNIGLLFAESYFKEAGKRTFDVLINGKPVLKAFDVFAAQGYKKPGYKGFDGIVPVGGYLTIQLKKVVENPFLNGIVISGAGAGSKAIGGPDVGPARAKGKCGGGGGGGNCDKKNVATNFESVHAAHAVTGDYVETDFKKQGFANVALNGLLSHSHGITNPLITKHVWTWTDSRTGKNVQKTGGSPKADFPVGSTKIKLYVEDSGCSTSEVTATVTVNSGTQAGAYCYYYDFKNQNPNTVPLPADAAANPKPQMSENVGDINFANTAGFGDLPFKGNTFAVRCQYYLDVEKAGQIQYKLLHSGPVKAFHNGELVASSDSKAANQMMLTTQKKYDTGLQQWEILYLKPKALQGKLIFQFSNGDVIPPEIVRHDSGSTLPVITSMNKNEGGEDTLMFVFGTAFVNGVMVKFGTAAAEIIGGDAGFVEVRVPAGTGVVPVTVSTSAGVSNSLPFTYGEVDYFPLKLTGDTLKKPGGGPFVLAEIAVIKYGPDGRLYCGSMRNNLHALRLNKALVVTKMFTKEIQDNWRRWILGLAFNPSDTNIKLYFSTSTVFWKQYSFIPDDAVGWKNGKIQSVTMSGPNGDFNNDVADVVTGLPVSNHDHAVGPIEFLPNGKMLISVGGFSNGGISVPGNTKIDGIGGFPENPLSGAIIECPSTGVTNIKYSTALPGPAKITSGGACKVYAPGVRNSFGMHYHTNGKLYATDNGPNDGFGPFATDCNGGQKDDFDVKDRLFLVEPGQCHGHPNLNRAMNDNKPKQCIFQNPECVQPIAKNFEPSTNGVVEYRSNIFGPEVQGNLFLSKFVPGCDPEKNDCSINLGRLSRLVLNVVGGVAANGRTEKFKSVSGVSIVEGPRGELIMSRARRFDEGFIVFKPSYKVPTTTMFISVMPRRGPAGGGNLVTVTGHNFGETPTATFGGKACTNPVSVDDETFTCTIPAGAKNTQVKVTVEGKAGISSGISTDYWYH